MEQKEPIKDLFERYLSGTYTKEDADQLLAYFGSADSEQELKALVENALQEDIDLTALDQQIKAVDVLAYATLRQHVRPAMVRDWSFMRVAASIAVMIGLAWAVYQFAYKPNTPITTTISEIGNDIAPGTDRAILSFDDGKEFVLAGDREGIVNSEGAVRYQDGQLVTNLESSRQITLRTPLAGQYQASLPDGTKVWLNAGSEISYPSSFGTRQREVSIKGEVYFEVAKDPSRPFLVASDGQLVEVLGTHFNINAYQDDDMILTTLSEGRVLVLPSPNGEEVILKPGQQSQNRRTGTLQVLEVDLDQVLSWKDGLYILRDQEMGIFGKQIARWYDVEVDMGPYTSHRLSAIIPRSAKLSAVLEAITLETGIHFKIEERRVTAIRN